MSVAVLLHLPNDVYRALVPVAAKHDTQVHHLIEASVTKSVRRKKRSNSRLTAEQLATIRRLNAEGKSDAAIAKVIGVAQSRSGGRQKKAVQT